MLAPMARAPAPVQTTVRRRPSHWRTGRTRGADRRLPTTCRLLVHATVLSVHPKQNLADWAMGPHVLKMHAFSGKFNKYLLKPENGKYKLIYSIML